MHSAVDVGSIIITAVNLQLVWVNWKATVLDLMYCIMMAMMNYTIRHSQFPQMASGRMMPSDLPWMSEPLAFYELVVLQ